MSKESRIEAAMREIPDMADYRKVYEKAMDGKSRKFAVKAFCLMCVGWEREEVGLCTSPECPLFPYRPFRRSKLRNKVAEKGSKIEGKE